MLGQRLATAAVLLAVFGAALFLAPPIAWTGLCAAMALPAAWEWGRLSGLSRPSTALFSGVVVACMLVLVLSPGAPWLPASCVLATAFWVIVAPAWLWRRPKGSAAWLAATGIVCLVPGFAALAVLRDQGAWSLLAVMAIVWISDTAAYLTGRRFGRRKLAPAISPGKTWEGLWGALVAVAVYAGLVAAFAPGLLGSYSWAPALLAALVFAVLGVIGDLFESQLKRAAGAKDSGTLLPGHGGVLDRIDALLPVLPAAAWLFGR